MEDGLYQVTTNLFCAGFVIEGGQVTCCAPILRKRIGHWMTVAQPTQPIRKENETMSLLKNLKTDDSIANEKDSLGGGGVAESGLYPGKIKLAYLIKSQGGATGLVVNIKGDREIRQTLWMTGGDAKGNKNFFVDKNGEKQYLPGFTLANSLALLAAGKEIAECDTETKVVNAYSVEAKAEVPTKVEMVMDLLDKDIIVGLIKQVVDKTAKNDTGVYVPTGETREENDIDKFFRAKDRMTTAEIRGGAEEASFIVKWEEKNAGVTRQKAKGAGANGTAGAPKANGAAGAAQVKKPATSLFA